jgi:putative tryptophan/tyrosine transport system substrate-binding protein
MMFSRKSRAACNVISDLSFHKMNAEERSEDVQAATRARGWPIKVLRAGSESDLESAFATLGEQQISGLLVQADPFFFSQRHRLASLALRHAVPAIYEDRGYVEAGGLISYGANRTEPRRAGGIRRSPKRSV